MSKPNLLLLHGALGTVAQLDSLTALLDDLFTLHRFEFEGHGQTPLRDRPLLTRFMLKDVVDFLDQQSITHTHLFGYSLGGYISAHLAHSHPTRVDHVITLGTRFRWDDATVGREAKMLNPEKIEEKVPHFAQMLAGQHVATDWKLLVRETLASMQANADDGGLSPEFMAQLTTPMRIIVGDRDTMAEVPESHLIYQAMLAAKCSVEFQVLPNTPHPFDRVDIVQLAESIKSFLL